MDERGCNISVCAVERNQRRKHVAIVGVALQSFIQHRNGFRRAAARMQRDGVNVGVLRVTWLQFCGRSKLGKRFVRSFQPGQCKPECMSYRQRSRGEVASRRAQHAFAFAVAAQPPIEVGKIDGRSRVLRAEAQGSLVFGLGVDRSVRAAPESSPASSALPAARHWRVARRRIPLPPASKRARSGLRLACDRDRREQRDRPDADAAHGIGQKRGHQWPDLGGRHVLQHVQRADPYHRIGIGKPGSRDAIFAGETREASSPSALARATAGALLVRGEDAKQRGGVGLIGARGMECRADRSASPYGSGRTIVRRRRPPIAPACRGGNRCRRSACQV